jgi:hypothetical protein
MTTHDSTRLGSLFGAAIGLCLAVPSGRAGEPPAIRRFAARPEIGAVLLTWTLPSTTTFTRVVIRYRVNGSTPSSPTAGLPLFDEPTEAGAMYGTIHSGLSPENTYAYAVFALDASGAVKAHATAVGAPLSMQRPAIVQNLRRTDAGGGVPRAPSSGPGRR